MQLPAAFYRLSLLARVLLMVGVTVGLTYGASAFLFVRSELAFYRANNEQELRVALDVLEKSVAEQAVIGDYALIEQLLRARARHSHFLEIDYSDSEGNVVSATDPQDSPIYPSWFRSWFDLSDRPVSRMIAVGGQEYGQITVWMSHVAFRNQVWRTLTQQVLLVVVVGVVLVVLVAWVLRKGLMPLRTATELALSLRRGEYQCLASAPENAAPEIRDTLATFNDAATREAWLARFAEIISEIDSPVRKVRSVMALLCARLDMQGAVLAYQAPAGGFAIKAEYFAAETAHRVDWTAWAAQVAAFGKPVVTGGKTEALGDAETGPVAYIGVPVVMSGYQCVVLSLFGGGLSNNGRNGEVDLMELCADWIGTALAQAEYDQRMREQKEHVESVLNGVMEGIVTLDHHGVIISANPAMERIFQYGADSLLGQSLASILPALNWAFVESRLALQSAQAGIGDVVWQERGRRRDGETVQLEVSARPVRRGEAPLTVVVLRDVTERVRSEQALRRSEARRRRTQEIAQLGSLEYYPATGETQWSAELHRILGEFPAGNHSFQDFLTCVVPEDQPLVQQAFEAGLRVGEAFRIEFRIACTGVESRHVVLTAEAPEHDTAGTKVFAVVQDITDAKLAEVRVRDALVEKLQAEAHNRAKTLFLANMSHELRTPLNAILGYSEMLEEDARAQGNGSAVSDLRKIQSSGRHLLSMINEVLDLSKIEAGRIELVMEDSAVRPLLEEAVATVAPLAAKNGNALTVDLQLENAIVHTDATKLKQVVINLLGNACKFTRDGQVQLTAGTRQAGGRDWLQLVVKDTGIGMTSEQLERVFVPFVQADTSTSRKYGGTGLGLAISKRFAEMLGGEIAAASEYGRGSTFTLLIPMDGNGAGRDGSAAVAEETHVVAAARRRLEGFSAVDRRKHVATILVLEHDPVLRELMERNLSGEGFRVVSMSGSTGLEQLVEQHRPALLVLDIDAPTMIPAELAAALRDGDLAGHVPLVLVGPPHLPQALSSMRATEYLAKPLNWGMLVASCKKWARAQPQPDDAVPVLHAGGG